MTEEAELRRTFEEVEALLQRGAFGEALKVMDELASEAPDDPDVAYGRAKVIGLISPPRGVSAAQDLMKRFPNDYRGPLLYARSNLECHFPKHALRGVEMAAKLGAPASFCGPYRARALILLGRKEEALQAARAGTDTDSINLVFQLDPPKTRDELEELLGRLTRAGGPRDLVGAVRAQWFWDQGMAVEAVSAASSALESDPESSALNNRLAYFEALRGDPAAAERRWRSMLDRNPFDSDARDGITWLARRRRDFRALLRVFWGYMALLLNPRRAP